MTADGSARPAGPLTERTPRVVSAVKLHRVAERRRRGLFLAEGVNAVEAALAAGAAEEVYCTAAAGDRHRELLAVAASRGTAVHAVTERAARRLADTVAPQGIVAVCRSVTRGLDAVPPAGSAGGRGFVAVAVAVSDPGNAGTIIRIADAMGAAAVVFAGDCVDPHNGKCVRSSAGSVFHVPVVVERDLPASLARLRTEGFRLLATAADGDVDLDDAGELVRGAVAWLFGNEAHGLDPAASAAADHRLSIPIEGRAESLNLAASAAICLYASARSARRRAPGG